MVSIIFNLDCPASGDAWYFHGYCPKHKMKRIGTLPLLFLTAGFLRAEVVSPNTNLTAREEQIIAAARAATAPRFNGAPCVGIRLGTPLVYSLSVSGERPMTFSAKKLPRGLALDARTGIVSGSLNEPGEYEFTAAAKNSTGEVSAEIRIVCGDKLALTPPMGWNSYDAFGDSVTEAETLANAAWLKEHLQPLGWDTVVVDFRWYDSKADGIRPQEPRRRGD